MITTYAQEIVKMINKNRKMEKTAQEKENASKVENNVIENSFTNDEKDNK